ncbi:asparagine synthase (glutamine-hydrolyzing) [bacterium J17]|nr:asparagine synthase (glutamine-hydrolyzing) [bacterium J17]
MCGVFGYFDRKGDALDRSLVKKMGETLSHRGPDDFGLFFSKSAAIGNTRLSIIDIAHGHQPFVSEDSQIAVVQNGEIYNYLELREELIALGHRFNTNSDTEVILRLYQEYGLDFLEMLNGMFAVAIWLEREQKLILARDRIGIKPLYFVDQSDRLSFASEIKAFQAIGVNLRISASSVNTFLTFNYIPPPDTIYSSVKQLMPGELLIANSKGIVRSSWWEVPGDVDDTRDERSWSEELYETFDDAVRLRLRADVPCGAFLSGGLDSSSVVSRMCERFPGRPKTFSVGFGEQRLNESQFAAAVAETFDTEHHAITIGDEVLARWPDVMYYCDQPHGDTSFLPTLLLSELAASEVKVVLTGDGADEIFAGYSRYLSILEDLENGISLQDSITTRASLFSLSQRRELFSADFIADIDIGYPANLVGCFLASRDGRDSINDALFLDVKMLLPGNNLMKPDRMGMSASLEARVPFLDHRLVELAFSMPSKFKLKEGSVKSIVKTAFRPHLGGQVVDRDKQMFTVPVAKWFIDRMNLLERDVLLSERTIDRGVFSAEYLKTLAENFRDSPREHVRQIRALLALEVWFRRCVDGEQMIIPGLENSKEFFKCAV